MTRSDRKIMALATALVAAFALLAVFAGSASAATNTNCRGIEYQGLTVTINGTNTTCAFADQVAVIAAFEAPYVKGKWTTNMGGGPTTKTSARGIWHFRFDPNNADVGVVATQGRILIVMLVSR
jgi:uncharacterized membrane protein